MSCYKPEGAFYIFPNFSYYMNKSYNGSTVKNSLDPALYLVNEARITSVPGSAFGNEGFMRFSYTASMEKLSDAVNRLKPALEKFN